MTKAELIDAVADKTGFTKDVARQAVNAAFDVVTEAVAAGDTVQVTGFGTFGSRARKARTGVKPGTTEKIEIPASTAPFFKAGKSLKDAVNK